MPTIGSGFYFELRKGHNNFLMEPIYQSSFQKWLKTPDKSWLNIPLRFCTSQCLRNFLSFFEANTITYIKGQKEIIIIIWSGDYCLIVLRRNLPMQIRNEFDLVLIKSRFRAYLSTKEGKLYMAKNLEIGYRLEDAARIYDSLEMWEEAGRVRGKGFLTLNSNPP
jgi:hypothetical protein